MVEAVIRLPGGLVPFRPGYETALWVLTQARGSRWRGRVLLADVSDPAAHRRGDQRPRRGRGHLAARRLLAGRAPPRVRPAGRGRRPDRPAPAARGQRPAASLASARRTGEPAGHATSPGSASDLDRIGATATADRRHVATESLAAADQSPAVGVHRCPDPAPAAHPAPGHQDQARRTSRPHRATTSCSARKRCSASAGRASAGSTARRSPGPTRTPGSPSQATSWSPCPRARPR